MTAEKLGDRLHWIVVNGAKRFFPERFAEDSGFVETLVWLRYCVLAGLLTDDVPREEVLHDMLRANSEIDHMRRRGGLPLLRRRRWRPDTFASLVRH